MATARHTRSIFKHAEDYHRYPSSRPFNVGIVLSTLWVVSLVFYISHSIGWVAFVQQPMDAMGNFFEGAFAPLLFLWIVIGFFLQQNDIAENAANIAKQAQQNQLTTFLSLSNLVLQQLGVISGHIYMSTQGPTANGRETEESASMLWTKFHNDERIFIRRLLEFGSAAEGPEKLRPEIYFGGERVRRHTEDYVRTFEKLITDAEACDPDYVLRDALLTGTGQGVLYRTIMDAKLQMEMSEDNLELKLRSVS